MAGRGRGLSGAGPPGATGRSSKPAAPVRRMLGVGSHPSGLWVWVAVSGRAVLVAAVELGAWMRRTGGEDACWRLSGIRMSVSQPDSTGHFGPYGGRCVPEVHMAPLELAAAIKSIRACGVDGQKDHKKMRRF